MATQSPRNDAVRLAALRRDEHILSSLRILVVEDDIEMADMIRLLLEREGYSVVEVNSGKDALELIAAVARGKDVPFDLALVDIMLPYVSGYEVCQEIRRTESLGYIPIILITALDSMQDVVIGLDGGADDYVAKPFNTGELLARVRAGLRVRDADQAMRRRNWQLVVLNALNDAISGSLDPLEVLRAGLGQVLQRLDLDYVVAFLREPQTDEIERVFYYQGDRWSEQWIDQGVGPLGKSGQGTWQERDAYQLALNVMGTGQHRCQTEAWGWPTVPEGRKDWRACVPLKTKSPAAFGGSQPGESILVDTNHPAPQVLGMLLVGAAADTSMIDLDLLTAIGNQIGQALEKCHFYQHASDRSEELVALFDSISDLIYVVDNGYQIRAVNVALRQWLAERRDDSPSGVDPLSMAALGQICYQVLYERQRPCEGCQTLDALRSGEHVQWVARQRRSAASREEWEISAYPIRGRPTGPSQAIVLARDVTERRMLEASLRQSEKLAAVGQLAAGLAHEINNPLTAILANVQLLLMDTPPDDMRFESLSFIRQASNRAIRVVHNLLDFTRQEQYQFRPMDLNASLRSALELVSYQFLSAEIEVIKDLAPALPLALGSGEHLQGVWLNLLLNARDAITQQARGVMERRVWLSSRRRDDGWLEITIRDNGVGMSSEQLNHIFEPFFTTKAPGKGTGLGLSTAYHIISQHGGEIQVDSELGAGTTFMVLLPALAQ
jgi:two-component system NtrC family sensor kinase